MSISLLYNIKSIVVRVHIYLLKRFYQLIGPYFIDIAESKTDCRQNN